MNLKFTLIGIISLFHSISICQSLEEDISVQYMKANVLLESARYDEAVRMYNGILSADDNYAMALFMRGKAKYYLGAYKGTKMDMMSFLEKRGPTKDFLHWMAKTEIKLRNFASAKNYVDLALEMDPYEPALYFQQAQIALEIGNRNDACEALGKAAQLGHAQAKADLGEHCLGWTTNFSSDSGDDGANTGSATEDTLLSENESNYRNNAPPVDLTSVQVIEIDEGLSLEMTNGLGDRKVEFQPNIFLLSADSGLVVIDLCVNSSGKVTSAEFNTERSTIFRSSLTSLALRKAREFVFMASLNLEQCGTMIYRFEGE